MSDILSVPDCPYQRGWSLWSLRNDVLFTETTVGEHSGTHLPKWGDPKSKECSIDSTDFIASDSGKVETFRHLDNECKYSNLFGFVVDLVYVTRSLLRSLVRSKGLNFLLRGDNSRRTNCLITNVDNFVRRSV